MREGAEQERRKKSKRVTRQSKQRKSANEGDDPLNTEKRGGDMDDETESFVSGDEAPSEYESMLQKYEAEVRNHIKIEQQLKLHIECV